MDQTIMDTLCICYNPKSGGGTVKADIEKAFGRFKARLIFVKLDANVDNGIADALKQGAKVLVAAGGDGTVNAIAQQAVTHNMPMAVMPTGTLNHFAKDIGMPSDLEAAAAAITRGHLKRIDYASVNGTVFLNNSSLGLYPRLVRKRDRKADTVGKWPAAGIALWHSLSNLRIMHLKFDIDGQTSVYHTPLVFVGNNDYHPERMGFTNRDQLSDGVLSLHIVRAQSIWGLCKLVVRLGFGKSPSSDQFVNQECTSFTITSSKPQIDVSMDGETKYFTTPLKYQIHAHGLQLCAPK